MRRFWEQGTSRVSKAKCGIGKECRRFWCGLYNVPTIRSATYRSRIAIIGQRFWYHTVYKNHRVGRQKNASYPTFWCRPLPIYLSRCLNKPSRYLLRGQLFMTIIPYFIQKQPCIVFVLVRSAKPFGEQALILPTYKISKKPLPNT